MCVIICLREKKITDKRLVIFPMSGNNTFETLKFEAARVSRSLPRCFYGKKILGNMKQMILCSLSKKFVFSRLLTVEKSKSKSEKRNLLDIKLVFESIVFMKPVSINSNTNWLRPNEIP